MKKVISVAIVLILMMSIIPMVETTNASAASSAAVSTAIRGRLPIVTRANPLSGATRIHPFTSQTAAGKNTSLWIDSFLDEIVITDITSDGQRVLVSYPSTSVGVRTLWFATDDVLGIGTVSVSSYTAAANSNVFRMSGASSVSGYGAIYRSDNCIGLGSRTVGSTAYFPTIYPVSSQTVNRVGGIRNKIALATTSGGAAATVKESSSIRGADSAIAWATARLGSQAFNGYCQAFVHGAYNRGAGIDIGGYWCAKACADAKVRFTDYNAPRGALVFWNYIARDGRNLGHVGIALGDGRFIHASSNGGVRIDHINGYSNSRYIGWGYPV